jgi:hypothetical protein
MRLDGAPEADISRSVRLDNREQRVEVPVEPASTIWNSTASLLLMWEYRLPARRPTASPMSRIDVDG